MLILLAFDGVNLVIKLGFYCYVGGQFFGKKQVDGFTDSDCLLRPYRVLQLKIMAAAVSVTPLLATNGAHI